MSKTYSLTRVQVLPAPLKKVMQFFSDPDNLAQITPPGIFMETNAKGNATMYAGQIIEYKMRPLLNIPIYWMTEITHVTENFFTDEQRFGPYSLWHHRHFFKEVPGGTEMTDIVYYRLPMWFFGDIVHALFVKKKLKEIFDYRYAAAERIFGP